MSDNFSSRVIATLQSLRSQSNEIQSQLSNYEILGSASAAQAAAQEYTDNQLSNIELLPSQTGNSGEFLVTDGIDASWSNIVTANSASAVAIIARGVASQTANLQEWQNHSSSVTSYISNNGDFYSSGIISDSSGNIRRIPQNDKTSGYTLVSSDTGKHISITTGGITVPASVFSIGDAVSIYNNSASSQIITQGSSVTLRQAGTENTGNRTLAQYGLCTILCVASNVFAISGAGLT